ncbi:MAG: bacillithiol biosynthesis deacetylase BshB1 [Blastocatellia bacterium]|nr:bacillithiol biosynthesis deacetylase BshB1 [Blastocatellia bacterium]
MQIDTCPVDVLAVGAHPDDVELAVGGTLIKLSSLGYKTAVVDMARGEGGTRGNAETRLLEAAEAKKVMGLTARDNLALPDSNIWCNEQSRVLMVRIIRKFQPKIIFTHYWEDPHPDHVQTAQIVRQAAHLAGLAKYDQETGQPRHRPSTVAHFMFPRTVVATFLVDISEFAERKRQAILCYKSQLHNPTNKEPETYLSKSNFLAKVEVGQRYFGSLIDVEHAEAFLVREALNVADPVELLTKSMNMYS